MKMPPFFAGALLFLCTHADCIPPQPLETVSLSGVSQSNDTPAQAYSHARFNLLGGAQYARAVRQLQFCVAHTPKDRSYLLALGCAYADRAASIGYAATWTQTWQAELTAYPQALKDWQEAQADPKADGYGDPKPVPPPERSFPTKDDRQAFTLSSAQATTQIGSLCRSAQAAWKQAVALASTPTERADAEWVQGCGLRLLRLTAIDVEGDIRPRGSAVGLPTQKDVVNALTAATKDAPQNPVYWQSLGDALHVTGSDRSNAPALAAYRKSLALQPVNPPLWMRVYQSQVKTVRAPQPEAEAALRHVIDSDPNNGYPRYLLAALLLHRTHFSDINGNGPEGVAPALAATYDDAQYKDADAALSEMEAANVAPLYVISKYIAPLPELLTGFSLWRPITRWQDDGFQEMTRLREMARAASGYGRICAAHGDRAGLERGTRATVGMGLKMAGDWPVRDTPGGSEVIQTLVGFAVTSIGFSGLVKGYTQIGDTPAADAAQAEWDVLKAQHAAWKQVFEPILNSATIYDDY